MSSAQTQALRHSARHLLPLFAGRRSLDAITSQVIGNADFTGSGKSVYVGFDPTSDRLHLGNMFQIVSLARASLTGLQPIFLLGTATAKIGDPSGKSQERTMLDDDQVTSNANSISRHVQLVIRNMRNHINNSGSSYQLESEIPEFSFQGNLEFYSGMNSLSFLANVGRHFRVNTLLSRDSVQNRLNSQEGISFTEFSYQLLQAYDFLKLYQTRKCILQIGGSDQWGNIVSGVELVRKLEKQTVYGLTTPLLTTTDGKKFGKSEGNAIWVTQQPEDLLEMYQYLINLPDPLIEDLLFRLTFLPESEIQHTMAAHNTRPDDSIPKKRLAHEILSYITGSKDKAEGVSKYSTYFNLDLDSLKQKSRQEIINEFSNVLNTVKLSRSQDFEPSRSILEVLKQAQIRDSVSKLVKVAKQGALRINNVKVDDLTDKITCKHFELIADCLWVVRSGKKDYHAVLFV